jgi:hypothetical protein
VRAPEHVVAHPARGDLDRAREAAGAEGPVRHDAEVAQAEQHRAAVRLRVDLRAQPAQRRLEQQPAELGAQRGHRRLAHGPQQHVGGPLHHLQRDVARVAVRDEHVADALADREPLDVADELDPARVRAQLRVRGDDVLGALGGLLAVGEQRHARALDPHHDLHEGRAHVGELDEVLGPHGDVRARVEQQERGAGNRHDDRQRRAVHAAGALEAEERGGERGAGRAAGDDRLRATGGDRLDGLHDRGLGRRAHGPRGVGGLRDRDRGVDDLDAGAGQLAGGAEQDHVDPALGGEGGAARHLRGAEVGPVRVDRDRDPLDHVGPLGPSGRGRDRGRDRRGPRPHDRRRSRSAGRHGAGAAAGGTAGTC